MRYAALFLLAVLALAQSPSSLPISINTTVPIRDGAFTTSDEPIDTALKMRWTAFVLAANDSVATCSFYATAASTANVDALTAEVIELVPQMYYLPQALVTYDDANNRINLVQEWANGDVVRVQAATTMPTGLTANADYYVCNRTSTYFQVDDDVGCASVVTDFSGSSGDQLIRKVVATSTTHPTVTAATWIPFSSFSAHTTTAGKVYACIVRNTEAAPATDYPTFRTAYYLDGSPSATMQPGTFFGGGGMQQSSRIGDHGSFIVTTGGVGLGNPTSGVGATAEIYGTREIGNRFTTPANAKYRACGAWFNMLRDGSPPDRAGIKVYQIGAGTDTLVASALIPTSQSVQAISGTNNFVILPAYWSAVELAADTAHRLVLYTSNGDASNRYKLIEHVLMPGSDDALKWSPLAQGTTTKGARRTVCTGTCTTTANWTDTATVIVGGWGLILCDSQPFGVVAGSGGQYGFGHAH